MKRLLFALMSLVLLAACQAQTETPLIIPTPIEDSAEVTPDPTDLPQPPTAEIPAMIATAMGTPAAEPTPPIPPANTKPRPTPEILIPPPINEPAGESALAGYQVAFVEPGDTLNVRSGPGANFPVVAELAPDVTGLTIDSDVQALVAGSTWVSVGGADAEGYVNSRFLTESVSSAEFCNDPTIDALLDDLQTAVANRDGAALAALVHPERGLRLRHDWWNTEVFVPGDEVSTLFSDNTAVDWGTAGGSGLPITGSFSATLLPLLDRDLLPATQTACNEVIHGPTTGLTIVPESYSAVPFMGLYRAAGPNDNEFDWGTWAVGIERWGGAYYLSTLVHYAYEI